MHILVNVLSYLDPFASLQRPSRKMLKKSGARAFKQQLKACIRMNTADVPQFLQE